MGVRINTLFSVILMDTTCGIVYLLVVLVASLLVFVAARLVGLELVALFSLELTRKTSRHLLHSPS